MENVQSFDTLPIAMALILSIIIKQVILSLAHIAQKTLRDKIQEIFIIILLLTAKNIIV